MRVAGLLMIPGSLLVVAMAACSSAQPTVNDFGDDPNAPQTPVPTRPSTTKTDNTCLGKESLGFEKPVCNTCMNADGCCQATIGCFKDNADCETYCR